MNRTKTAQKSCRSMFITIFLFCLCCSGSLHAQNLQKQFSPEEIFSMAWGNSTGQVGLLKVPGRNYGPQGFAVDEKDSKIYTLDSTNQRILVFDTRGNLLSFILISEKADDLCLGNKGNVYVLYSSENKVVEYSFNGSVIRTFPVANTASPIVGIYFNSDQGLSFETSEEISYPLIKKETVISSPVAQIERKITGLIRNHDSLFLECLHIQRLKSNKEGEGLSASTNKRAC